MTLIPAPVRRSTALAIALTAVAVTFNIAPVSPASAATGRVDRSQRAPEVSLRAPRVADSRIAFSGRVRNTAKGTPVAIQCRKGGRWQTLVRTRTVNARGTFKVTISAHLLTMTATCRAQAPARRTRPAATSPTRIVRLPSIHRKPTNGSGFKVSQCHWNAAGTVSGPTYTACLRIPCNLSNPVNYFTCAGRVGEFQNPSWTTLPAASVYNTTPTCPVAVGNPYCSVPLLAAPPPDPGNSEWLLRARNADGTWDQNATGYVNSAYWPSEKRPDIQNYALPAAAKDCASRMWHYCYLSGAEAVGYPLGHTPVVGDLAVYPGECDAPVWNADLTEDSPGQDCDPSTNMDWYAEYVEQVNPDGTWVGSDAGLCIPACQYGADDLDTAYDSGIVIALHAPSMDPDVEFIGLMPAGSPKPHR